MDSETPLSGGVKALSSPSAAGALRVMAFRFAEYSVGPSDQWRRWPSLDQCGQDAPSLLTSVTGKALASLEASADCGPGASGMT